MREVNYLDSILYGVAHILGVDTTHDLLKDHARPWANAINTRLRYAWEFWDWPEFMVTEERALRQVWYTDVDYTSGEGDNSEVYYIPNDTYYRVTANPPVGTLPTNVTYFTPITFADLDRYIAYEQNGKQDIGQVYGIYNSSPRANVPTIQWGASPSGLGLDIGYLTATTIWITYKPKPPQFTSNTYSTTASYRRGDVVLDLDSGDCYLALRSSANNALNLPAYWLRQEFPYTLSEYVKYAAASDHADDVQRGDRLMSQAEEFLTREVDKQTESGQVHHYGPKLPYRMPLGLSGYTPIYWSSVTP